MSNRGREMIEAAVPRRPGESVKGYLARVSKETRIGYRSLVECWKGYYWSKETAAILEAKVNNNENDLSSKVQRLVADIEAAAATAVNVGQDGRVCDAFRDLGQRARNLHRELGQSHEGSKVLKIAIAVAVAASAFLIVLPEAQAQIYPVQWDYGVRYPRPPGGGTRPRPRPPKPVPPPPTKPPPGGKPPGYWGYR